MAGMPAMHSPVFSRRRRSSAGVLPKETSWCSRYSTARERLAAPVTGRSSGAPGAAGCGAE
eukprot:9808235-Lingulodinium_polyedra.AAC.1